MFLFLGDGVLKATSVIAQETVAQVSTDLPVLQSPASWDSKDLPHGSEFLEHLLAYVVFVFCFFSISSIRISFVWLPDCEP